MADYRALLTDENKELLRRHLFFSGLGEDEIASFITFSAADLIEIEPGQKISLDPGSKRKLGIVIAGDVKVYAIDYDGNKTIINALHGKGAIGTMQFMMDHYNMLFEVVADTPAKLVTFDPYVLLIADARLVNVQHSVLVNVLASQRNLFFDLSAHLMCLSQKNIRDKIMCYLHNCSESTRSYEFDIPFSREELAAYLAVDRASLSRSLGDLKREGIIEYKKNHFIILTTRQFKF